MQLATCSHKLAGINWQFEAHQYSLKTIWGLSIINKTQLAAHQLSTHNCQIKTMLGMLFWGRKYLLQWTDIASEQQEILRTPYLTRHRTGQVERLMGCDQIEAKIMKYHTLSGGGMSAVNLAKFNRKVLLSSKSNWASWQMISHKHNWKQIVGSVDRGILFNMHSSYLLCSGSAVRTEKLQAQFQLHFYDLRGSTLNLAQPWTKFSKNETNKRIIIRTSRFIIIT